ncbi:MAG: hypothetical protein BGO55_16285 [Sphingobacteriales bacterium 50-39]|nr:MAG: hypothetical protein BGO55_16285 [Sphingobacteriales bacterium 50-39]
MLPDGQMYRVMKLLNVPIDEFEYAKLGLTSDTISFRDLKEKLNIDYAKEALIQCNDIAERTGLSQLSLDDINAEINAVRNAKSSH